MNNLEEFNDQVASLFKRIEQEDMQGIPLMNEQLQVEVISAQEWRDGYLAVLVTPWFMNLIYWGAEDQDRFDSLIGKKNRHEFPARDLQLTVNEVDGLGVFQSLPICSPMFQFKNQDAARLMAATYLLKLMQPAEGPDESVDEKRMQRYLAGETMEAIKRDELEQTREIEENQAAARAEDALGPAGQSKRRMFVP